MNAGRSSRANPRIIVAQSIRRAAERFADLGPVELNVAPLDARDRALALAIHRNVLQRWLTLQYLIDRHAKQPLRDMEPAMQAVLLTGAAQLVFMDRLPPHAVVDEAVRSARKLVRPGAAGLVNAVLRRVAQDIVGTVRDQPWTIGRDRLPVDDGYVQLRGEPLPPAVPLSRYLEVATSTPSRLIEHWFGAEGESRAVQLAVQTTRVPPTIVAVEPGFDLASCGDACRAHAMQGFIVWDAGREKLIDFLRGHAARRVQDPASTLAVASTASLDAKLIIDYCAGRGTKTRQLAAQHPEARIIATDVDASRFADLAQTFADHPRVRVMKVDDVRRDFAGQADLLLLDVPCSNTAVFARRPEARYRWSDRATRELVALQRRIIADALPLVAPAGHILYSTCSLDERENQQQAKWLANQARGRIAHDALTWPDGAGDTYHDGSYHALVARPG